MYSFDEHRKQGHDEQKEALCLLEDIWAACLNNVFWELWAGLTNYKQGLYKL